MKFNLIVLRTSNLDNTLRFYNLLGLSFNEEKHGNGPIHYSCTLDDIVLEIYPASPKNPAEKSTTLGFSIPSIDIMAEKLTVNHIDFKFIDQNNIVAIDSDGRKIYLSTILNKY